MFVILTLHSVLVSEQEVFPQMTPTTPSRNCYFCGKCFMSQRDLRYHMNAHTGEKPYKCGICGKGFTQKANLKMHERVHTGEKAYKCSVCGNSYTPDIWLTIQRPITQMLTEFKLY